MLIARSMLSLMLVVGVQTSKPPWRGYYSKNSVNFARAYNNNHPSSNMILIKSQVPTAILWIFYLSKNFTTYLWFTKYLTESFYYIIELVIKFHENLSRVSNYILVDVLGGKDLLHGRWWRSLRYAANPCANQMRPKLSRFLLVRRLNTILYIRAPKTGWAIKRSQAEI